MPFHILHQKKEEEYKKWLKRASEKFASISGDRQKSIALAEKN